MAPGRARLEGSGAGSVTFTASTVIAAESLVISPAFPASALSCAKADARSRGGARPDAWRTASHRLGQCRRRRLPGGHPVVYRFGGHGIKVTVLSDRSATASSLGSSRLLAVVVIAVSAARVRVLGARIARPPRPDQPVFWRRRGVWAVAFSATIPTEGRDDFAARRRVQQHVLQLSQRLDELSQERARVRESPADRADLRLESRSSCLLELALKTALDAVQADRAVSACALVSIGRWRKPRAWD